MTSLMLMFGTKGARSMALELANEPAKHDEDEVAMLIIAVA